MTITGRQIREARRLLNWNRESLVKRAKLSFRVVGRAEASDGEARITVAHEAAIRRAFEAVGIAFGVGDDGGPDVRLQRGPRTMIPTGRQIRDGRALAGLSQAELAAAADVALGLLVRVEGTDGLPMVTRRDSVAIQQALEAAGVEFVQENGSTGVRLRRA